MKLEDFGAYFIHPEPNRVILFMYFKTTLMPKTLPDNKRPPNKIMYAMFENGIDYVADKPVSYKEFRDILHSLTIKLYDYRDYDAASLHKEFKKLDLKKKQNEKWFESQYAFIDDQIAKAKEGV